MKGFIEFPEFDGHEFVSFFSDSKTGLEGCVAIHNTNLGPAAGGTRYWHYAHKENAVRDALRLSRAMTYKCALAGVPYGGGKAVIFASSKHPKTHAFLGAYAARINLLGGNYYTGEDVGISQKDIDFLAKKSPYIIGRSSRAGDLGPWAALGVYAAAKAAVQAAFGTASLRGRSFAIKGLGKVGLGLARLVIAEGAIVTGADIDPNVLRTVRKEFPKMKFADTRRIHRERVDVYAPCAMNGEFSRTTIPQLRCAVVCGGANNQLVAGDDGARLHRAGILYVPDYLANAGGLINVVGEMRKGGYDRAWVRRKTLAVGRTAARVIALSARKRKPMSEVADELAESIFRSSK